MGNEEIVDRTETDSRRAPLARGGMDLPRRRRSGHWARGQPHHGAPRARARRV